jgi:hypothetical protein
LRHCASATAWSLDANGCALVEIVAAVGCPAVLQPAAASDTTAAAIAHHAFMGSD